MMRTLIDTNVVLDALASREPFRADAEKIFMLTAEDKLQAFVTANSITDIYYLLRKHISDAAARETLRNLFQLFTVVGIDGGDCETALDLPIADYEDALVATCASKAGLTYIVTRDEDFLQTQTDLRIVSPAVLLREFFRAGE